jgi:hypothetical protein
VHAVFMEVFLSVLFDGVFVVEGVSEFSNLVRCC